MNANDRRQIYGLLCQKQPKRAIGRAIGRAASTVIREIRRSSDAIGYNPREESRVKAPRRRQRRIDKNPQLKAYILEKMDLGWAPEVISGSLKKLDKSMHISTESIYSWIYLKENDHLKLSEKLLRRKKVRGKFKHKRRESITNKVSIHERPEYINDRSEPGNWEGDLMFQKGNMSQNLCTAIERVSRMAALMRNESKHTEKVMTNLTKHPLLQGGACKSITLDNGTEFAKHSIITENIGAQVYFCDPSSPWQKGAIEQLNALLRRWFKFSLDASEITNENVEMIEYLINHRPRKILGFKTPCEVYSQNMNIGCLYEKFGCCN